ncbi:MAG: hypothetical protein ABIH89_05860 [Elusimicrobiota bacterium]
MNIYVGNLDKSATNDQLRKLFERFGRVDYVNIITDDITGRPMGFGFLEMPSEAQAQTAILILSGSNHMGKRIEVHEAPILKDEAAKIPFLQPEIKKIIREKQSMKLFVAGFPENTTEDELIETFSRYGTVLSLIIVEDESSAVSKRYAFVHMADRLQAQNAIVGLNGTIYKGSEIRVNPSRASDERRSGKDRRNSGNDRREDS